MKKYLLRSNFFIDILRNNVRFGINNLTTANKQEWGMVRRITISISDELAKKIEAVEHGLSKEFSLSAICQSALESSLESLQRRDAIAKDGFKFGEDYVESLSCEEQKLAKRMVENWPRKHPDKVYDIFLRAGLISTDNLEKHLDLFKYWKSVHERFEHIKGFGNTDDWDYWIGSPVVHDGVEISETAIQETHIVEVKLADGTSEKREIAVNLSTADIRYNKAVELWRHGLISGIKKATKSIMVSE